MSDLLFAPAAQPSELSLLVDLEARWENLRANRVLNGVKEETASSLQHKQKAYEAFQSKLMAYNKRFKPAYVPGLLINTPRRLGEWCRRMREAFARLEQGARVMYPAHLMERAYRSADHVADQLHRERVSRPSAANDISGAVRELESLARWCESMAPAKYDDSATPLAS